MTTHNGLTPRELCNYWRAGCRQYLVDGMPEMTATAREELATLADLLRQAIDFIDSIDMDCPAMCRQRALLTGKTN